MADTYSARLKARKIEQDAYSGGGYAERFNEDVVEIFDASVSGTLEIDIGSDTTYLLEALQNGTLSETHYKRIVFIGTPATNVSIIIPDSVSFKEYVIDNQTGQIITIKYEDTPGVRIPNGVAALIQADGEYVEQYEIGDAITDAEVSSAVPLTDFTYRPLVPFRYGADGDGGAEDDAAFAAVISVMAESTGIDQWRNGLSVPGYHKNQLEINAEASIVDYTLESVKVERYVTNTTPGSTDLLAGFISALRCASPKKPVVEFANQAGISKTLVIDSGVQQNITLQGTGRVTSALMPLAVDISEAPESINCLIFNANNNPHLNLRSFQIYATVAYTGVAIYCKEGGGGNSSGQALFSSIFRDIWMGMPTTNGGFLKGGIQNCFFETMQFEGCKGGAFQLEGAGCVDNFFTNMSMLSSYDEFIVQTADTNGSFFTTVSNIHIYDHFRGRVINVKNWKYATISKIILEVSTANLGDTGLFKFQDCVGILVSDCEVLKRAETANAAVGVEIVGGFTGAFNKVRVNADTGLKFSGSGQLDITFTDCDFTDGTLNIEITGTQTGRVRFRNCKANNAQTHCIAVTSGTPAFDFDWDGEILNAGLGGAAGSRNVAIAGAMNWVFREPLIGRNSGSAVAAYYFDAAGGAGSVKVIRPVVSDTPPTGLKTGAQAVEIQYAEGYGGVLASAATLSLPFNGDVFEVSGTTGITGIDSANQQGRKIVLAFQSNPTVTDGGNLLLNANYTTSTADTLSLVCIGTNWYETARSAN